MKTMVLKAFYYSSGLSNSFLSFLASSIPSSHSWPPQFLPLIPGLVDLLLLFLASLNPSSHCFLTPATFTSSSFASFAEMSPATPGDGSCALDQRSLGGGDLLDEAQVSIGLRFGQKGRQLSCTSGPQP